MIIMIDNFYIALFSNSVELSALYIDINMSNPPPPTHTYTPQEGQRERERERERERDRDRDRETDRQTDRQTDRERERGRESLP